MGDIYTNPPQSRNEAILRATIDGTEYTAPPQSRIEDLLLELKKAIEEGGGGGGTTVVPNPEGEATGDLNKVQIGSTIFGVLGELGTAAKKNSTNAVIQDSSDLVESGAVYSDLDSKQPKTLDTPITIGGVSRTTVETALGALEDSKEDTILAATPLVKEYDEIMRQEVLRLTMDTAPTANSGNAVTSGGVKSAVSATVDLLKDTTGWTGKNKLPNVATSGSQAGANFTVNTDKSVLVNTPDKTTGNVFYFINDYTLKAGTYVLSGCPAGGSNSGYSLRITDGASVQDFGSGAEFTLSQDTLIKVRIVIGGGGNVTVTNKVFYPMICEKSVYNISPSYEPHHESVEEYAFPRSEQAVLGASGNELPITATSKTENGVTITVNADKTISISTDANGATADTSLIFNTDFVITDAKTHYFSGIEGGGASSIYLECYYRDNSNTYKGNTRIYDGVIPIKVSDYSGATKINTFLVMVKSGFIATTPKIIKPMVSPFADSVFAPYAMTNTQLTEKIGQELSVSGLTYTNCEYVAGGYVISGNICTINIRVKATANQGISISGLPYAKTSNNSNYISAIMHKVGGAITDSIPAYCTSDGLLSGFQNAVNDSNYLVSASYLIR